jgi:hypothetical protein
MAIIRSSITDIKYLFLLFLSFTACTKTITAHDASLLVEDAEPLRIKDAINIIRYAAAIDSHYDVLLNHACTDFVPLLLRTDFVPLLLRTDFVPLLLRTDFAPLLLRTDFVPLLLFGFELTDDRYGCIV